jgi:hypothetical protein
VVDRDIPMVPDMGARGCRTGWEDGTDGTNGRD